MNEEISKIKDLALECLRTLNVDFKEIKIGYLSTNAEVEPWETEFFYKNRNDQYIYVNESFSINEKALDVYLKMQVELQSLQENDYKKQNKWKYFNIFIQKDGLFTIDFKYEFIDWKDWRNQYLS